MRAATPAPPSGDCEPAPTAGASGTFDVGAPAVAGSDEVGGVPPTGGAGDAAGTVVGTGSRLRSPSGFDEPSPLLVMAPPCTLASAADAINAGSRPPCQ